MSEENFEQSNLNEKPIFLLIRWLKVAKIFELLVNARSLKVYCNKNEEEKLRFDCL